MSSSQVLKGLALILGAFFPPKMEMDVLSANKVEFRFSNLYDQSEIKEYLDSVGASYKYPLKKNRKMDNPVLVARGMHLGVMCKLRFGGAHD